MKDPFEDPIQQVGSFQDEGRRFASENPLDEVWQRLARFRSPDLARTLLKQDGGEIDEGALEYIRSRLSQALEFRAAAQGRSLMTSPLILYYSFLNLARATIALREGRTSTPAHGLRLCSTKHSNILDIEAALCSGTFSDLLAVAGTPCSAATFSLRKVLASIPELLSSSSPAVGPSRIARVQVIAYYDQPDIFLRFHSKDVPAEFRDGWTRMLPGLVPVAELAPQPTTLRITADVSSEDPGAISAFCHQHLLPELVPIQQPKWYAALHDELPQLDRAAYYLLGMFILSSIVRYDPNLLSRVIREGSDVAWILERFVAKAERFFPQLMYAHIARNLIYF